MFHEGDNTRIRNLHSFEPPFRGFDRRMIRCVALGVLAALFCGPAMADEAGDLAMKKVQDGEIVPLSTVVDMVSQQFGGQILEVEIEEEAIGEDGLPMPNPNHAPIDPEMDSVTYYEIKVLTTDGHLLKLKLNATTSDLIDVKGHDPREEKSEGNSATSSDHTEEKFDPVNQGDSPDSPNRGE
ncbi:MAG: hypothetical protein A2516_05085 [Alphaproteobacteria bacterium RIFOXYD12_FULL_60_8]|nr:MAG: hypothetical protein A2516_05085 [Alphaproteobacteria bacterium RIFOXYD12_FULL_60_8]